MLNQLAKMFQSVPQSEPLPGQVANNAGGFSFEVDDWVKLDRFLILGTEGGTYYVTPRKLTIQNAHAAQRCIAADGVRVVERIREISVSGRAPKNDAAIFVLGLALKTGDLATRRAASAAVPEICRTGTHLFQLAEVVNTFGGWGRGTKRTFADWYVRKSPRDLAFQLVKYPSREGWSHRDILRLAKPAGHGADTPHGALFAYAARAARPERGFAAVDPSLIFIDAVEQAKTADVPHLRRLVREHRLPWESIPTPRLGETSVWRTLLDADALPLGALLRNLARMTANGTLVVGDANVDLVAARLTDRKALSKARIHPLGVLAALVTYQSGKGARGELTWKPVPKIVSALDKAFYAAFANVEPTGKRWYLAVDVSGSMDGGTLGGFPGISPRVGAAAMAMVTAKVEERCQVGGFTSSGGNWLGGGLTPIDVEDRRLDDVVRAMRALPMGGTDCALPIVEATRRKLPVDVFVVYTDSETWAGNVHPAQALRDYRAKMGIPAKLIVVGMVANGFTIADPKDAGMLDVVGFDAAAPAILRSFAV